MQRTNRSPRMCPGLRGALKSGWRGLRNLGTHRDDVATRTRQDEINRDSVLVSAVTDGRQVVVEGNGPGKFSVSEARWKRIESPAVHRDCGHVRSPKRRVLSEPPYG